MKKTLVSNERYKEKKANNENDDNDDDYKRVITTYSTQKELTERLEYKSVRRFL